MEKEFLGYAYLNNEISEIYAEDYPDYGIIPGDKSGVSLINEDIGDSFFVYTNKIDLIDYNIESPRSSFIQLTPDLSPGIIP